MEGECGALARYGRHCKNVATTSLMCGMLKWTLSPCVCHSAMKGVQTKKGKDFQNSWRSIRHVRESQVTHLRALPVFTAQLVAIRHVREHSGHLSQSIGGVHAQLAYCKILWADSPLMGTRKAANSTA